MITAEYTVILIIPGHVITAERGTEKAVTPVQPAEDHVMMMIIPGHVISAEHGIRKAAIPVQPAEDHAIPGHAVNAEL